MPETNIQVVSIDSTSFVTLNNKSFEKMMITNTGSSDLDFNLVFGDTRLIGETSVGSTYEAFFFLKGVEVPVGATLEIDGYSPTGIQKTDGTKLTRSTSRSATGRNKQDGKIKNLTETLTKVDFSFLVSCTASDSADIVVISNVY